MVKKSPGLAKSKTGFGRGGYNAASSSGVLLTEILRI
jgi:hypothetical protein